MALRVFNTLSREKEGFVPLHPPKVGLYSCGPTVYHYAHIGNLRSYVFADILRRTLMYNGFEVEHVMNITDVGHLTDDADDGEDKMEKGAAREGKTVWDIAEFYTEAFKKDITALNILPPTVWCKATDHIQEQIDQVKALEDAGVTYKTDDGIYFDTTKLQDYGKLIPGFKVENLEGGKRVGMGDKQHKTDFALWKFSPVGEKRQMEWDSPWGRGFPGWHIECSAMSSKYLGEQFDIHTGGIDHVPIHHTNEIAQAETAYGKKPWVKYWMHGEFLVLDKGEKMAKSDDNFLTLTKLQEDGYSPLVYRYFLLTAHYRQQLAFNTEAMDGAKASYERLHNIIDELEGNGTPSKKYVEEFVAAINDDLNMPKAVAVLWDVLRDKQLTDDVKRGTVAELDKVLGLNLLERERVDVPDDIKAFADERLEARDAKDWKKADAMRDKLREKGWEVRDNKEGYTLKKL